MAMTEDMDFPRLIPQDDRMPSDNRLLRKTGELPDDQFDLLAAARAEGQLDGDALTELDAVMTAIPLRRDRAESFLLLKLAPMNESWSGMRSCLRPLPTRIAIRRTIIPALMAAAAIIALIIMGPAGAKLTTSKSPDIASGTTGIASGTAGMTVAEIPASHPIEAVNNTIEIRGDHTAENVSHEAGVNAGNVSHEATVITINAIHEAGVMAEPVRELPLALGYGYAVPSAILHVNDSGMAPVRMTELSPSLILPEDRNWILRSISFLAGTVTGKEKKIDGYLIANNCITGINSILGWEMDLEKVNNMQGDPIAVSFTSSLLSFTKPLNKNSH